MFMPDLDLNVDPIEDPGSGQKSWIPADLDLNPQDWMMESRQADACG